MALACAATAEELYSVARQKFLSSGAVYAQEAQPYAYPRPQEYTSVQFKCQYMVDFDLYDLQ